jgi:hypothetical protein
MLNVNCLSLLVKLVEIRIYQMPRILKLRAFSYGQTAPLYVGGLGFWLYAEKKRMYMALDFLCRLLSSVMIGFCSWAHFKWDDFHFDRFLMLVNFAAVVLSPMIAINGLTIQNG